MYKKKYKINNAFLSFFLNSLVAILMINFFFQGARGKQIKELSFHFFFEIFIFLIINIFLESVLLSLTITHLISWLINGHIWVIFRYSSFYRHNLDDLRRKFLFIIDELIKNNNVDEIILIGSFTEGFNNINSHSDLDIRIFFKNGFINYWKINYLIVLLRAYSFFKKIPLDIYALSDLSPLKHFKKNESIIILKDKKSTIQNFLDVNCIKYEIRN